MGLDRRTVYTKRVIKEALLDLIEGSDINEITIKEICAKADINRATFYRHFDDIYDLYYQIAFEIIAPSLERNRDNKSFIEALPEQLELIKRHQHFFLSIQKHGVNLQTSQGNIDENRERYVNSRIAEGEDPFTANATFEFVSGGVSQLIKLWTLNGCQEPIDQLVDSIAKICDKIYS